jgi:hypothetical protein
MLVQAALSTPVRCLPTMQLDRILPTAGHLRWRFGIYLTGERGLRAAKWIVFWLIANRRSHSRGEPCLREST